LAGPRTILAAVAAVVTVLGLASVQAPAAAASSSGRTAAARVQAGVHTVAQPAPHLTPVVRWAVRHGESVPLRSIKRLRLRRSGHIRVIPFHRPRRGTPAHPARLRAASVQRRMGPDSLPALQQNFEGIDFSSNGDPCQCLPPDTNGAVGPNDYVQTVNTSIAVYSKQGQPLLGPRDLAALWQGFGGACDPSVSGAADSGDPIVLYDEAADRWFVSQLAAPGGSQGFHACLAVSQTGDPTGAYFLYDFLFSQNTLNDYPKFGVWPDAYYMSANDFLGGSSFTGVTAVAFNRAAMLSGQPAQAVSFTISDPSFIYLLPSTAEGAALGFSPPAGAPDPYFMSCDPNSPDVGAPPCAGNQLDEWDFHVDWASPANSTFGNSGAPSLTLPTAAYNGNLCGGSDNCIPQPGTGQGLEPTADHVMHQAAYRNLGATQAVVLSQTVNVASTGNQAGVNWYELTNSGSGWSIAQQGTYAPDSDNRWMPSVNIDASGDIAVGYSVSSSSTFPSIRMAGRLASDPAGQLSQGETTLIAGTGSQLFGPRGRWGDYSAMQVDPADGCTFWYTNEYYTATANVNWQTRVGSFSFPSCVAPQHGHLVGTVTDAITGKPIAGAMVAVSNGSNFKTSASTDSQGNYILNVPVGSYTETISSFRYLAKTISGVQVTDGGTTTENVTLSVAPITLVTGTITDGSGHGWPLYASISVTGDPAGPFFTDPATGQYAIALPRNRTYNLTYTATLPGYPPASDTVAVGTAPVIHNVSLPIGVACTAPGYGFTLSQGFDQGGTGPPAGWTIVNSLGQGNDQWRFDDPEGRGSQTGGQGGFAIADALASPSAAEDTALVSPVIDLSGAANPVVLFHSAYRNRFEPGVAGNFANVDVSTDGGQTWANVWARTATAPGPDLESVPIPQAAGHSQVRVRFHYASTHLGFWQVDDVGIGTCNKIPGGLVVGTVRDANTGAAVNGATVTSGDNPSDTTTTVATPADPEVGGGYYQMFSSLTGPHPFTATKTLANGAEWGPATKIVNVKADTATEGDIRVGAGQLTIKPASVAESVALGGTTTDTVVINNTGTAPATVNLAERFGGPAATATAARPGQPAAAAAAAVAAGQGAPLRRISLADGKRVSPGWLGRRSTAGRPGVGAATAAPAAKLSAGLPTIGAAAAAPAHTWSAIAPYPGSGGIMDNSADFLDGTVYSVGGFDGSNVVATGFAYNVYTGTWTKIASMPVTREKPNVAFAGGRLYVTGGWNPIGVPIAETDSYDPVRNTWTTVSPDPQPTAAAGVAVAGGEIYVVGGCTNAFCSTTSSTVARYDPVAGTWASVAPYPHPVAWESCGGIRGIVYCAGGFDGTNSHSDGYAYNPATNSWSPIASLPIDLWGSAGGAANGQLVVSAGVTDNGNTITNQAFGYDPSANAWAALPNAQDPVLRPGGACGFYKIGGDNSGFFTPVTGAEALSGLDLCGEDNVPWLSVSPASVTLQPGDGVAVKVTLTATQAAGVSQPGTFTAQLAVSDTTPYPVAPINITMTVQPPSAPGLSAR
jgi:N-acetylneuraminic acid mutarotase